MMDDAHNSGACRHAALVVGRNLQIQEVVRGELQQRGWVIECVQSNISALQAVEDRPFDLVVTSEETSGDEDIQLLRHLRRVRPHLRMIILAGLGTRADVIAAMREHAFWYFTEPLSMHDLAAAVRTAVDSPSWDDGIELVSANDAWIRLFARCDAGTAERLENFIFEIADDVPEDERRAVSTAFRELLFNAMEHGGRFDPREFVEISYLRSRRAVACRIKDPGQGFSLEQVRHAAINNPPDDPLRHLAHRAARNMRVGGYGVLVARELVDELIYGERGNEVLLIKYIGPKAGPAR